MSSEPGDKSATDNMPDAAVEQPWVLSADLHCPECGYSLRGIASDRCPECGYALAQLKSLESSIPWTRRREIGFWRAYFATMWMVMFRNKQFCNEIAKPLSFADSQAYRWTTVVLVCVPICIALEALIWFELYPAIRSALVLWQFVAFAMIVPVMVFLYFAAATGIPGYFFHPRFLPVSVQNRAIVLSYYTSGPVFLLWISVVLAILAALRPRGEFGIDDTAVTYVMLAVALPVASIGPWWLDILHVAHRSLRRNAFVTARLAVLIPVCWFVSFFLIFLGIPAILVFLFGVLA